MELLRVGALKTAQAAIWPDDAIVTNSKSDLWAFSRESDVQDWVSWSWWGCFTGTEVHLKLQHLADELEGLLILAKDIWSIISTAYLWKVEYYLFSCENFWLSRDVNPRQEGKRKKVCQMGGKLDRNCPLCGSSLPPRLETVTISSKSGLSAKLQAHFKDVHLAE